MSRRDRIGTSTRFGEWEGYEIYVDNKGTFFVLDEGGRLEAPSLDALKGKLKKPVKFKAPVKAVRLLDRYYDADDEDDPTWKDHEVIEVTGLSPTGQIYYTDADGRKERHSPRSYIGNNIYVFDEVKLAERTRLLKIEREAKRALESLHKEFTAITRDNAAEIRAQQADAAGEKAAS